MKNKVLLSYRELLCDCQSTMMLNIKIRLQQHKVDH